MQEHVWVIVSTRELSRNESEPKGLARKFHYFKKRVKEKIIRADWPNIFFNN
jgi:hypothetical protein